MKIQFTQLTRIHRNPNLGPLHKLIKDCWNHNDEIRPDFSTVLPMILKITQDNVDMFDLVDKLSEEETGCDHLLSSKNWSDMEEDRVRSVIDLVDTTRHKL